MEISQESDQPRGWQLAPASIVHRTSAIIDNENENAKTRRAEKCGCVMERRINRINLTIIQF
jgi:hypothetical protein